MFAAGAAPATFDELFRQGLLSLQRGDLDAALYALTEAVQLQPENSRVRLALAQVYWKQHDPVRSAQAANEALRWGAKDPLTQQSLHIYYFEASQSLLREAKFAAAIDMLRSAVEKLGPDPQLQLALGVAYYGLRRFEESADTLLAVIANSPEQKKAYVFLGKMLDQVPGRLPAITARFVVFEKANPTDYEGYLLHAKALNAQSKDPAEAEGLLRKSIGMNGEDASAHFELGSVLDRERKYLEAASEFERAELLDASDAVTHYRLSRLYQRLNKPEAAAREQGLHQKLVTAQNASR